MSDCIDRQLLINLLTSRAETLRGLYGDLGGAASGVRKLVQTLPSVEPKRKKGEWIDEKINSYTSRTYCSECGLSAPFVYKSDDYYGNHAYGETVKTKFCPNCGAEMRGEYG